MSRSINRASVAALIPAFREARWIQDIVRRTLAQLSTVVVVDDGSTDATAEEARRGGAEVLSHSVNQGKGAAIKTGLRALKDRPGIDYILLLDGDGQHAPEEIPHFLEAAAASDADFLLGDRMSKPTGMPLVRYVTNRFVSSQLSRLCGQLISDSQCGFRMVKMSLAGALQCPSNNYDYESEMLIVAARQGCRIEAVPISTIYRGCRSKIHPIRDTMRYFRLLARLRQPPRLQMIDPPTARRPFQTSSASSMSVRKTPL